MAISKTAKNEFLIDLETINVSPGELIDRLSKFNKIHILEWNQYTEYAIGKILYLGEMTTVLWEDFPNTIGFYSKSKEVLQALEYDLRNQA